MPYARREREGWVWAVTFVLVAMTMRSARAGDLSAADILRGAERQRGCPNAYSFRARIIPEANDGGASGMLDASPSATLVEVRSNGFAQQLVVVLEPNRGDVMLATPEAVWLRPRRLHRLTRIPPDLRMFNSVSVADVTAIDLAGTYVAALDVGADDDPTQYRITLTASKDGARYPRAVYRVRRDDLRPIQIDFMTASSKVLKTLVYGDFQPALGRTIPTRLTIRDHVFHDSSVVRMFDFQALSSADPVMFTPDYLLTIEDPT